MTRRSLLAALLLLLAGCLTTPELPPRPPVGEIASFAFSGRIAVRQDQTRHYARIAWRHDAQGDEIFIATPLGQGVAQITRDAQGARLVLADRRQVEAADWTELARQVFGIHLPLEGSERWLLGQVSIIDGWLLTVTEREGDTSDGLPTLIELEREDIQVRLKIDEWSEVR